MAVYTTVSSEALGVFLEDYDIGAALSCVGIAEGIENSNYLLTTPLGRYILTLYERRVNAAELPWFLGLMQHLAAHGLACPTPVIGHDGEALRQLEGRPAALTTFLPGRPVSVIDTIACHALGAGLARLHALGRGYEAERPNTLGMASWAKLLAACGDAGEQLRAGLTTVVSDEICVLVAEWPALDRLPRGQIHADLFPDNAFFQNDALSGIIDFYFACTDFLAYDLAICLNAWCCPDDARPQQALIQAMLDGYESVRPLEDGEWEALPTFCRGAAIRFLLTRLYDWGHTPDGAVVTRKDPLAYWRRLMAWREMAGVLKRG
ncbi:homoserine kinase [Brytella acorum]|uniref:Homoserine kinase n=1 Tax=Brytella acorum TaxID=2959299 RepID=A0AA35Y4T0_9PROT|nr:homoserine kinase [Brytella acorum]MDF3626051.1 homoserine kinase [Brytella acorum]CAI9122152.1 homoserine kinase [Brytella acorum]